MTSVDVVIYSRRSCASNFVCAALSNMYFGKLQRSHSVSPNYKERCGKGIPSNTCSYFNDLEFGEMPFDSRCSNITNNQVTRK